MSPITTHILDTSRGVPAGGVPIVLELQSTTGWKELARGVTNEDGRIPGLLPDDHKLEMTTYRMTFEIEKYFINNKVKYFYPYVQVVFQIAEPGGHYHVPLLMNPFGYSTYRGS